MENPTGQNIPQDSFGKPKQKGQIPSWLGFVIIIVFSALAFGAVFTFQYYLKQKINRQGSQTACTMEAKQCPDGSYVGRTGPNCEFAECPDQTADWQAFYDKYKDNFEKDGGMFEKLTIAKDTVLFSPDNKLVSFIVVGYEYSKPYLVNVNSAVNILEGYNIWFSDPKKSLFWSQDGKLFAVKNSLNEFSGEGKDAILVGEENNKLKEIFALANTYQLEKQIENVRFLGNKLLFSEGQTNYSYDFQTQVLSNTAGWKTYRNEEYGFELKYPGYFKTAESLSPTQGTVYLFQAVFEDFKIGCNFYSKIIPESLVEKNQAGNSHNFRFNKSTFLMNDKLIYKLQFFGGFMGGYWEYNKVLSQFYDGSIDCSVYKGKQPPLPFEEEQNILKKAGLLTEEEIILSEQIISTFKFTK